MANRGEIRDNERGEQDQGHHGLDEEEEEEEEQQANRRRKTKSEREVRKSMFYIVFNRVDEKINNNATIIMAIRCDSHDAPLKTDATSAEAQKIVPRERCTGIMGVKYWVLSQGLGQWLQAVNGS